MRHPSFPLRLSLAAMLMAGCSTAPTAPSMPPPAPTPGPSAAVAATVTPSPTQSSWAADLAAFDQLVRTQHPSPWTIHPESEWVATMARIAPKLEAASKDEQIVLVSELVGLLDTHSAFVTVPGGLHWYGLLPYRFSDGWFVIRADDPTLVGSRLVSIGGAPIDTVVQRLTPLVPHDNPNGLLEGLVWLLNSVEYLHGSGIVADAAHPAFELLRPDGAAVTVDPDPADEQTYRLVDPGWLNGPAATVPEAVARRAEPIWTRLDTKRHVLLVAVNDYGDETQAISELEAAFASTKADRLVFDMRYLQGGSGDIKIIESIRDDPRINRPGVVTVLTGRENVSAATQVVYFFDTQTKALLVGEATPARAANFTCECRDLTLRNSGFVVSVPLHWDYPGDPRPAIEPEIPMTLSSVDFFAGRDPVLAAALKGLRAP